MEKADEKTKENFGLRLAKLREKKNISARSMSLELGQNKNYINSIENGNNYPTMDNFFEICEYLQVTPQYFFDEKVEYTSQQEDFLAFARANIRELTPDKLYHLQLLMGDMLDSEKD